MAKKRYDSKHRLLRTGESERTDGYYVYRWTGRNGQRHSITASTLEELREKEDKKAKDKQDGIRTEAKNVTVNDIYDLWREMKRGIKDNTFRNYCYMYEQFVKDEVGKLRVQNLKKSDIKRFYNLLVDERNLQITTVDNIHTVLHQVLTVAVEDGYMRTNVSDNVLKELKQAHNFGEDKKKALTEAEQELFLDFLRSEKTRYHHWYPVFAVMLGTGMRVGEVTGLRWCDIDMEKGMIEVNHTLVYYNHAENGCYFNVHTPKTKAGVRQIPMLDYVKEAFIQEKRYQEFNAMRCKATIDGYTDFIFINRFGGVQHQGTLNKAIRRITRECNEKQLNSNSDVLLPRFSCHSLRHTFTTRLVEQGVNIKVVQDVLGHKDVKTTLNIYTDATQELKQREFEALQKKMTNRGDGRDKPEKAVKTSENQV
ncbi:tyrosine-type recombinase/integrase [Sellimonas intestinalis]|uniref:tyrosine-type recombinase/integrase n=1 Tax=Sellimonas intestinalis TaxID=1653434 RepID=UPI0015EC8EB1|nr:tyrosine-type recombinase/integrase [Sellimonas intestinalis]MBA2214169.1 site-specific integrase [Sellimonas intestinalis]